MRLWIVAIGRAKPGPERDLVADYAARVAQIGAGLALSPLSVKEVEVKASSKGDMKAREAEALTKALPPRASWIALDERGPSPTSADFAKDLAKRRDQGVGDLAFVIGGADGLDATFRAQASASMALGAMTWPHMLVRVLIAEQIYRAVTILAGHPYHRA